jgi:DNA-binding LacI/PurR family transcriptional regulator
MEEDGERQLNIGEIARRANVSTATVSRTLNQSGAVRPETARKVWRAAAALNYYPNSHARALVSGRSRLLGLIVADICWIGSYVRGRCRGHRLRRALPVDRRQPPGR